MTDIMGRSTAAHLEPWRDARRIPEQYSADAPATFEWWYVDAQLTGGRTVVAAFVVEPDTAHQRFAYRTQVFVMRADGPRRTLSHRTYDDVAISAERPDIRIGQSSLRGDGDTYRLVIDPANHAGFGLDVVITGAVPGRVAPDGTDVILGGEDGFGWVNAVPRGNLAGTMTENGQTTEIRGIAYHDHNWGTATMGSAFQRWIWGRAAIGPFTAVFLNIAPTSAYRTGGSDVQSLYVVSADEVLVNVSGEGVAKVTAPIAPNPDPDNREAYFAQQVVFEREDRGRRFTLEINPARFIHHIDLVKDTTYLDADERARAAQMTIKPWYTEFVAAPVRLTVDDGDGVGEPQITEGTGIIEFMDFHLAQ